MNRKHFLITIFLLASSCASAYAQLALRENPQPVSPQAAEMTKYGTHNVNLYTGRIGVNIPIGVYKDADFEVPVSLSYNYNGFRPNEQPSEVGLGWAVSCGGVITREVRGIPDEEPGRFKFVVDNGCVFSDIHPLDTIPWNSISNLTPVYFEALGNDVRYDKAVNAAYSVNGTLYDANPDVYHFNFLGHSGSFVRRMDGSFAVFDTNGETTYKVSKKNAFSGTVSGGYLSKITIVTSDGYKYVFGDDSDAWQFCDRIAIEKKPEEEEPLGTIVSWKLNKIISPGGREMYFYYSRKQETLLKIRNFDASLWYAYSSLGPSSTNLYSKNSYTNQSPIEGVYLDDKGYVVSFEYGVKDVSLAGKFINGTGYNNLIDLETSTKLLDCITIQGEMTDFSYSWSTNGNTYPFLSEISSPCTGVYKFEYDGITTGYFPEYYSQAYDHWGYLNSTNSSVCQSSTVTWNQISSLGYNSYEESLNSSKHSNYTAASLGLLKRIVYPGGGCSEFSYEENTNSTAIQKASTNNYYHHENLSDLTGPGARIKKIVNRDVDGSAKDSLSYSYIGFGNKPSGRMIAYPRHRIAYGGLLCGQPMSIGYITTATIGRRGDVIVEYPCVTEHRSDGSKIEYEFTDWSMFPDTLRYSASPIPRYYGAGASDYDVLYISNSPAELRRILAPSISRSPMRGKLLRKKEYAAGDLSPIRTTEYYYDSLNTESYREFLNIGDAIANLRHSAYKPQMIATTETYHYSGGDVQSSVSRTFNIFNQVTSETTTRADSTMLRTCYTYPSDYPSVPVLTAMASAGINGYPVTITKEEKGLGASTWTLVSATRYTFAEFLNANGDKMYLPVTIENQDVISGQWKTAETKTYNSHGYLTSSTDANGFVTSFVWNSGADGPTQITQNAGQSDARTWTIQYFRPGLPSSITGPDGITKTWTYDDAGRLTAEAESGIGKIFNMVYSTKSRQR